MNSGHGHVFPRADGVRARCGGPGICSECSIDLARRERQQKSSGVAAAAYIYRNGRPLFCGLDEQQVMRLKVMYAHITGKDAEHLSPLEELDLGPAGVIWNSAIEAAMAVQKADSRWGISHLLRRSWRAWS